MPIKGILFDFDGLILDTETPKYNTWCEIYDEHQQKFTLDLWSKCLGTDHKNFDPLTNLGEAVNKPLNLNAINENFLQRSLQIILSQPALPGVTDILDSAQSLGIRVGVASSGERGWVQGHLERLGLLNRFNCVYTREDVKWVKPAPELYQRGMAHLQTKPEETIVFEDSPNGITAARSAGCYCVAVPNEISKQLDLSQANLKLKALNEIPLLNIISCLTDNKGKLN